MNQPPQPQTPQAQRTKVYVEGRYRKLVRDLPQTVFFCPDCKGHPRRRRKCERCEGFGKLTRESVQELIGWVAGKAFGTRKNKFHGAGREDLDVRMLGQGRPFVMEMVNPKVFDVDLAALEAEINRRNEGRIEVLGLHWTEKARVSYLKETPHAKEYEALVELDGELDASKLEAAPLWPLGERFEVVQHTPQRVSHRRAKLDRVRWVELLEITPVVEGDEGFDADGLARLRVRMRTQHGTYVKEVLGGDEGRTQPSLAGLLGVGCRCVQLDVTDILDAEGGEGEVRAEATASRSFGAGL